MSQPLLMIPGPIELEPAVAAAAARPPLGHLDPELVAMFSRALGGLREVFRAPDGQPFVVAGSGTLAMEMGVANLIERGDRAVVVDSGYFSARMATLLERHGAQVRRVGAGLGDLPTLAEVEAALSSGPARVLTITHVDTSTGVLAPVRELAALGARHGALVVVDGICSVAAEPLEMQAWGVDLVLTASQKALGAPPGLAIVMAGPRAMAALGARRTPVASYYADFGEWLPIMQAYEARKAAYFATPATTLVAALDAAVASVIAEGLPARWARHGRIAAAMNAAWSALSLRPLPRRPELAAHTLSALYYPEGVDAQLVGRIRDQGVVVAGGLHPEARARYFRVGHMGATGEPEIRRTVAAVARALGQPEQPAVAAAIRALRG